MSIFFGLSNAGCQSGENRLEADSPRPAVDKGARVRGTRLVAARLLLFATLHRQTDWTDGCIAVTNGEIDEIWGLVAVGTPAEIRP